MSLTVIMEFSDYSPWGQAVSFYNEIKEEGKLDALERVLEDLYPEGCSDTTINDILAYDEDSVREWLDMPSEEQIRQRAFEKWNESKWDYVRVITDFPDAFTTNIKDFCDNKDCAECHCGRETEWLECEDELVAKMLNLTKDDIIDLYKNDEL